MILKSLYKVYKGKIRYILFFYLLKVIPLFEELLLLLSLFGYIYDEDDDDDVLGLGVKFCELNCFFSALCLAL